MKTSIFFAALLCLAPAAFAHEGGASTVGVPNPAYKNCADRGGIAKDDLCQVGKGFVGLWTLFNANHGETPQAVAAFFDGTPRDVQVSNGGENPASLYCASIGGSLTLTEDQYGICTFPDQSSIEEWALYSGATDAYYSDLTAALKFRKPLAE